jgi:hypothetical protein
VVLIAFVGVGGVTAVLAAESLFSDDCDGGAVSRCASTAALIISTADSNAAMLLPKFACFVSSVF